MSNNCSGYAWSHLKLKCFIREVFNLRDVSRSRRLQSVVGGDCEIKSPFNRNSQLIQLPTPPISPEPWNLITLYPKYFNITIAVGTRGIILTFLLYLFQVVNMCNKSASSRTDCRKKNARTTNYFILNPFSTDITKTWSLQPQTVWNGLKLENLAHRFTPLSEERSRFTLIQRILKALKEIM